MRKVIRYALSPDFEQVLRVPKTARILSVGMSGRLPAIWVLADPGEQDTKTLKLFVVADNVDITFPFSTASFLGTVANGSGKVRHIFVIGE